MLTTSTDDDAATAWLTFPGIGRHTRRGGSLVKCRLAADRSTNYRPHPRDAAIATVVDTLDVIRGRNFRDHTSQSRLLFDTSSLRACFRSFDDREFSNSI